MLGNVIADQFLKVGDYPFGSALAMSLMVAADRDPALRPLPAAPLRGGRVRHEAPVRARRRLARSSSRCLWAPIGLVVASTRVNSDESLARLGRLHDALVRRGARRPRVRDALRDEPRGRRCSRPSSSLAIAVTAALWARRASHARPARARRHAPTCGSSCPRPSLAIGLFLLLRRYDVALGVVDDRDRPRRLQLRLRDDRHPGAHRDADPTTLEEAAADLGATPWRVVPAGHAAADPARA